MTGNFSQKKEIKGIKSQYEDLPTSQKKRGCREQQDLYRKDVPPTNGMAPMSSANNLRLAKDVPTNDGPNIFDDDDNKCTCKTSEIDTPHNKNVKYRNRHNTIRTV